MAGRPTFPVVALNFYSSAPFEFSYITPFRGSAETVFVTLATTSFRDSFRLVVAFAQQSEPFIFPTRVPHGFQTITATIFID